MGAVSHWAAGSPWLSPTASRLSHVIGSCSLSKLAPKTPPPTFPPRPSALRPPPQAALLLFRGSERALIVTTALLGSFASIKGVAMLGEYYRGEYFVEAFDSLLIYQSSPQ